MSKQIQLGIALVLIIGAIVWLQSGKVTPQGDAGQNPLAEGTSREGFKPAQEISTPDAFINTSSTTIAAQLAANNVVLVDFWTYSCINCQHTLPYLNAWQEAYGDKGLTILGIHTPEFEFEKELSNVQKAVDQFGIRYPVVLDNDYSTWRAYNNRYWPRKYLVNLDGYVTYDHVGEGGYEETEQHIRTLLEERAQRLGIDAHLPKELVSTHVDTGDTAMRNQTPELYFGASRNLYLANIARNTVGKQDAVLPDTFTTHNVYLGGAWNITDEYAEAAGQNTKIVLRFIAHRVNFVAESPAGTTLGLTLDGVPLDSVLISTPQLYHLVGDVKDDKPHTIEITIPDQGVKAFTFTFG